jgi:hypothetical protein
VRRFQKRKRPTPVGTTQGAQWHSAKTSCHHAEDSAMPVSLSDDELRIVMDCAQPLAPKDRDKFLRDIAHQLSTYPEELGPGAVHRLVREIQQRYFDPPRFATTLSAPRPRRTGAEEQRKNRGQTTFLAKNRGQTTFLQEQGTDHVSSFV